MLRQVGAKLSRNRIGHPYHEVISCHMNKSNKIIVLELLMTITSCSFIIGSGWVISAAVESVRGRACVS